MELWLIAAIMVVGGGLLAFAIYQRTEGEYPVVYWLAWGVAVGGLLVLVGYFNPLRANYLRWSSAFALVLTVLFLAGKVHDEFLPAAWIGVGILGSNLLLFTLGSFLPTQILAGSCGVVAIGLLALGYRLQMQGASLYDAAYSIAAIFAIVAGLLGTRAIQTPLENLNMVVIPRLNEAVNTAQLRVERYQTGLTQAQQYRAQIDQQFGDDDAAYLEMTDRYIATAVNSYTEAEKILQQIHDPQPYVSEYDPELTRWIDARTERAKMAATQAQMALDQLGGVQKLFEQLSEEWIKAYLWFEVDGYWTSEENESPSYNVCYYGERFSLRTGDGTQETIVSDEVEQTGNHPGFGSDQRNVHWKYFTVADYNDLVNAGVVAADGQTINSDEEAGYYLCGQSPQSGQYGALGEPPIVIEKEYGSLTREANDEGGSFVGNYRYGAWCVIQSNGSPKWIPEDQPPPQDAQWCWYQQPGGSTNYYWERRPQGSTYIWIRSHRRCIYCTPQASWGGGELVPDAEMARVNGTERSSIRGPTDQGGGPGTGK